MRLHFSKMHGIGNDYVYLNCMERAPAHPGRLSVLLSNRHFGIGSDGLVLILPSKKADFQMRMFNADGSEGRMCGNASRCVAKYVYDTGLTQKNGYYSGDTQRDKTHHHANRKWQGMPGAGRYGACYIRSQGNSRTMQRGSFCPTAIGSLWANLLCHLCQYGKSPCCGVL